MDPYDPGLLGNGGGGDTNWWQNYIRVLLRQAHDHYFAQWEALDDDFDADRKG